MIAIVNVWIFFGKKQGGVISFIFCLALIIISNRSELLPISSYLWMFELNKINKILKLHQQKAWTHLNLSAYLFLNSEICRRLILIEFSIPVIII